ncbi:SinI family autotransporter-associated protein [Buttiauxella selenatireducens]|uniref:SinI family autotransporter-associated protein n=1 Tax=Buttiauxella selenatireducens TaxID=3073902 RepID=A0ABY9SHE8_9ENTR|nr:SinI family autotransporter-associated protein [Buttiauxella sp. R73]WMY75846.1 SinI family autotransporter-associated protein [Buttiauxella sp. R73]
MKTFNKTLLASFVFVSCSPFAMAVMTDSAGTLNGTVPVITSGPGGPDHTVSFSNDHTGGSIDGMVPGDKISLAYLIKDAEGDKDSSNTSIKWFTTTDGVGANKKMLSGSDGKDFYTIQNTDAGLYLGAEITEQTSTGVPATGQTIVINDVSKNDSSDGIPDGPIVGGTIGTAIVDSAEPTVNLIGKADSKLQVGHTYQFQVWYDVNNNGTKDAGELDASANYNYKWVFGGTSATTGTAGGDAVSSTDNKDLTIPATNVDAKNVFATAGADGVQGYSLKVDYNAKVKAVLKSTKRK